MNKCMLTRTHTCLHTLAPVPHSWTCTHILRVCKRLSSNMHWMPTRRAQVREDSARWAILNVALVPLCTALFLPSLPQPRRPSMRPCFSWLLPSFLSLSFLPGSIPAWGIPYRDATVICLSRGLGSDYSEPPTPCLPLPLMTSGTHKSMEPFDRRELRPG